MTKKSTKEKPFEGKQLRPSKPATELGAPVEQVQSIFEKAFMTEASQAFSSEEQALGFLVSNITDKLGGEGANKSQMHEFLRFVLETDPALKEEILEGIAIRK